MKKVLLIVANIGNNGQGKQVLSHVKFLSSTGKAKITLFITDESENFYEKDIMKYCILIKKNIFNSNNKTLHVLYKMFGFLDRRIRKRIIIDLIKTHDSTHIFGIKMFFRLRKFITVNNDVTVWHNTHKLQYTIADEEYLDELNKEELMRVQFITIDSLQVHELREKYGDDVKITEFKLFRL